MGEIPEILLIDKPKGITSFDVIRIVRRKLGVRKMGHAGTLDPAATGLMIIGIGSGTKKLHEYLKLPKTYEAVIRIGVQTTTGDLDGEIVEEKTVEKIGADDLTSVLEGMQGTLHLPVPKYSAVKISGQPLYKYAREGKEVEVPVKGMTVRDLRLHDIHCHDKVCDISLTIDVSSGTYIRSLAEEVGKRLGYPATLAVLRRTQIGEFFLEDAMTLEDLP